MIHSGNLKLDPPEIPILFAELQFRFNHYMKEQDELIKMKFDLIKKIILKDSAIKSNNSASFLGFSKSSQTLTKEIVNLQKELNEVEQSINHNQYTMEYLSIIIDKMVIAFEIDRRLLGIQFTPVEKNVVYKRLRSYILELLGCDENSDDQVYRSIVNKYDYYK